MGAELVTFKLAAGWIEKLARQYKKLTGQRIIELDPIADELLVIPQELAPLYIEPDLQPYSPADASGSEEEKFRVPALEFIEDFIKDHKEQSDGRRHLFILADAGMGKTSLLAMFKLAHVNGFWPKGYDCVPFKLGPNTLTRLKLLIGRGNTVLLLDALDEDSEAIGRIKERIIDILKETRNFLRVVITCRNQYLPLGDVSIFPRQDRIKLSGFTCPVKYVSPFNDNQVKRYLEKRYPSSWFKENRNSLQAKKIFRQTDDLRFRPMLLAYVDDILGEDVEGNLYLIYKKLIEKWLDREATKKEQGISQDKLLKACILLARDLSNSSSREVSEEKLDVILQGDPDLIGVKNISFGGRSLLNRNSDGGFRFAHQSFQEFLLVHSLEHGFQPNLHEPTEMIDLFLRVSGIKTLSGVILEGANLQGANLIGANIKNAHLVAADLRKSDLAEADMRSTNLTGADLAGADLRRAILVGANFSKADLRKANLAYTSLRDANLQGADLGGADMQKAGLLTANLNGANLRMTNMQKADLQKASLIGADLERVNLQEADLEGANLEWASLKGANLKGTDLKNAILEKTDLSYANLNKIKNWKQIDSLLNANIFEFRNAPDGFREWALRGAVEMPPEEWAEYKKKLQADK